MKKMTENSSKIPYLILGIGLLVIVITLVAVIFAVNSNDTLGNFERGISNLELSRNPEIIDLNYRDTYQINAEIVKTNINGNEIRMFGYNGQIPGPLLKAKQGSKISIDFTNKLDQETTVHWHGLRLDNAFDGVPDLTQKPIKPGETFRYELNLPDPGMYWYHPHLREDYQQELGLYGNILVIPKEEDYFNKVNREEFIFLDDIQIDRNDVSSFYKDVTTQALMGRFGNIMLINGKEDYTLNIKKGEVVRFFITNSANTRTFNLNIPNAEIKVIGSDGGAYEKEFFTEELIIAPSERYIIEVLFDNPGVYNLMNINPLKQYNLGKISVSTENVAEDLSSEFLKTNENNYMIKEVSELKKYINKDPDVELSLDLNFEGMMGGSMTQNMDHNMHGNTGMIHSGESNGIEWEDTMAMMNFGSTDNNVQWIIKDKKTGKTNEDIDYKWNKGEFVKIRLFNEPNSIHPMQHPIHFHGNRFIVLEKDGEVNKNFVWKDTVLVPKGSTTDILLEISNPGNWMAHCHIAEHLESGMMMEFEVI